MLLLFFCSLVIEYFCTAGVKDVKAGPGLYNFWVVAMSWSSMVAAVGQVPAVGVLIVGLESPLPHVYTVLYVPGSGGGGDEQVPLGDRVVASGLPMLGLKEGTIV